MLFHSINPVLSKIEELSTIHSSELHHIQVVKNTIRSLHKKN